MLRLIPLLLFTSSTAVAEVCDKVAGDGWTRDQGPVNVLTTEKVFWGLAVFVAASVVIVGVRSRRLAWMAAGSIALVTIGVGLATLAGDDTMTRAAIEDGCWSDVSVAGVIATILVFSLASAFFTWVACGRTMIR